MNILVLTHEYPPIGGGGGKVAQDLCQGLVKRGHNISVLTAHYENLPENDSEDGIQIIRLRVAGKKPTGLIFGRCLVLFGHHFGKV